YTGLPNEEHESRDAARGSNAGARESQQRLAEEITRLVHGESGLAAAKRAKEIFFGAEIDQLSDAQLVEIFADVPSKTLPRSRLEGAGLSVIDAVVEAGLGRVKGDRRERTGKGGPNVITGAAEGTDRSLALGNWDRRRGMV